MGYDPFFPVFMCMGMVHMPVYAFLHVCSVFAYIWSVLVHMNECVCGGRKRVLDHSSYNYRWGKPLELGAGNELQECGRAASTLVHGVVSPAPVTKFFICLFPTLALCKH